jgi:hypothetical protein
MKKQIYFAIIGIGAVLAIIGFIPGGMSGLWGVLIAGITAVVYFINTRNEAKVQERLAEEKGMFQRDAESGPEASASDAAQTTESAETEAEPEPEAADEEEESSDK